MDSNHRSNLQQIYSLSPLATRESIHDGAYRARTYDPLLVRQMLSQLSYAPIAVSLTQLLYYIKCVSTCQYLFSIFLKKVLQSIVGYFILAVLAFLW